jgi:hypothetical protein
MWALIAARLAEREVTEDDLVNAAVGAVPLSRSIKEQINHIHRRTTWQGWPRSTGT